jgi:hypothetical protein
VAEKAVPALVNQDSDPNDAMALVRRDLMASEKFKRDYQPTEKLKARRMAYEGDPNAFPWPYKNDGFRPYENFIFRQINHKISKLQALQMRLNLRDRKGREDEEMRLQLAACKQRLLQKGREASWSVGRKLMMLDAAKLGFGVRCVGVQMDRGRYVFRNWRVKAEEFHMDPMAEGPDDAEWKSWRRRVAESRLGSSGTKGPRGGATGDGLETDSRPRDIALETDEILYDGRSTDSRGNVFDGTPTEIVTDYYRKDPSLDYYYPCPNCETYTGVSMVMDPQSGMKVPQFKCANCGSKKKPEAAAMKRVPRYPNGKHIRLVGSQVDYAGVNRLLLQDGDPFVGMAWYDAETWVGMSETQILATPQILLNVSLAALADCATENAHPKLMTIDGGIISGNNNDANQPLVVTEAFYNKGGPKRLEAADVSPAVRLLLQEAMSHIYLLPGLSPESQGQAPDTIRSGVGLARVQAASEIGLVLPKDALIKADARFYRIIRDLCAQFDVSADIPMVNDQGIPGVVEYDRALMQEPFDIEILTDDDVDQQREELFSRAMEMRQIPNQQGTVGVTGIDDPLLLELSGIPEDILMRAQQRVAQQPVAAQQGLPPELGGAPSPTMGAAPPDVTPAVNPMTGPANKMAGRFAPRQTKPPSRSRGSESSVGALMNGAGR